MGKGPFFSLCTPVIPCFIIHLKRDRTRQFSPLKVKLI